MSGPSIWTKQSKRKGVAKLPRELEKSTGIEKSQFMLFFSLSVGRPEM
jgi:hypothetical protein